MRQIARVLDVGRKVQVEGRAVADLSVEITGRPVVDGEFGLRVLLVELTGAVRQGELQVRRGGYGEFMRGTRVSAGAKKRQQTGDGSQANRYHFCKTMVTYSGQKVGKRDDGGEGEIRTPGTLTGTPAFEAGAIDHSATSPRQYPTDRASC
jgi:hypothetical protein